MGFKVILTTQSLDDLKEIVAFIAEDNPDRARTFGNELIDRTLAISKFPEIGRMVPEIGLPVVREVIHGSYRIIYESSGNRKPSTCSDFGTERGENHKSSPGCNL